jgi:hypothetical protein
MEEHWGRLDRLVPNGRPQGVAVAGPNAFADDLEPLTRRAGNHKALDLLTGHVWELASAPKGLDQCIEAGQPSFVEPESNHIGMMAQNVGQEPGEPLVRREAGSAFAVPTGPPF